jgi:two-component system, response regulator PdtaR
MARRALIVDDNLALAEDLAEILTGAGYEIRVFDDPSAVLREASSLAFDVALLDVRMPGMDGVTLQQQLLTTHPGARIVLMTAHAEDQRIAQGLALGASAVLTKPVPLSRLFAALGDDAARKRAALGDDAAPKRASGEDPSEGGEREAGGDQAAHELLLVEDDPAFREALREVLADDGYRCHGAASVVEARRVIEAIKADGRALTIALIDVRLPGESGTVLARELSGGAGVPCLLMTGWEPDPAAPGAQPAPSVLVKPFSPDVLLRALAGVRGEGS